MQVTPDRCHEIVRDSITPKLSFDENGNYAEWKKQVREKLIELLGIDEIKNNLCPLNFEIEKEEQKEGYKQIRFTIESEKGAVVPVYVLIPDTGKEKYPVAITLQGHSSGFHNSIGEPKTPEEAEYALGRGKFAVQAAQHGYIAVAIEQRGMGESRPIKGNRVGAQMCAYTSLTGFLMGRTTLGERAWDVSRVIDVLHHFPQCDLSNIFITGNSGGGTMSFYAACYDERIKLSAPSCAFCSYKTSILDKHHCSCNYIPHAYKWFEMADLACLIAPRKFLVIAGKDDTIFPVDGVRDAFETVKKIYKKEGHEDRIKLVVTDKGHWWCEDLVWDNIAEMLSRA